MTVAGLIFANIHDDSISELTRMRTMASVPFGGRYRLIDFTLSNMVNAGIENIGIVTSYNYRSLLDHLGTGKDWDLARREAGIKILPPNITAYDIKNTGPESTMRLGSMLTASNFISRCGADCIVLSDCDTICNIDLADVIDRHVENGADITIVVKNYTDSDRIMSKNSIIRSDADGRVTDVRAYTPYEWKGGDISTNMIVVNRNYLLAQLAIASSRGYTSFFRDILAKHASKDRFFVYRFDGFYSFVNSIAGYFESSMELLDFGIREELFKNPLRPIHTKVRNSAPTLYKEGSRVVNSMIADGCVIEGEVENSIIFRGVRVRRGAKVKNSILMQDTIVGENVTLNCVITDKTAVIRDQCVLSGHRSMPFFIGKGVMV
ncbi:MAG: glucose-1-phosphate adenylyltransferase subunit GlgD [Clostridia bacterium]|nr:glucose-1-phosphate adenylyltransferase subunit GlgD [Clostridia bacterium]